MAKIVVRHYRPIHNILEDYRDELTVIATETKNEALEVLEDAEILITCGSCWEEEYLTALKEGSWVQLSSIGYDRFDLDKFAENGVTLANMHRHQTHSVADHAFALLLSLTRNMPHYYHEKSDRSWERDNGDNLSILEGKTITIYGLGEIGTAIAQRANGFGMNVNGIKRDTASGSNHISRDNIYPPNAFDGFIANTDVLVLSVPLTNGTHHLIDQNVFNRLPETALIINVARGSVIDQQSLIHALEEKQIAGAGLDVFEEEPLPETSALWELDNVVFTPHMAGRSNSYGERFVELFLENYDKWVQDKPIDNVIV